MSSSAPSALVAPSRAAPAKRPSRRLLPMLEVVLLVVGALLPLVLHDYQLALGTRILILALLALSFDLLWGYAGLMSFGQAVFFGIAGYGVGLVARDLQVTAAWIVLPLALLIGLVVALALGGFLLLGRRPAGPVFVALGTLTAGYAADRLARSWAWVGAENGLPSIAQLTLAGEPLGDGAGFYYLALVILVAAYLLCRMLVRSQVGLALVGLRENESRIAFFGYRTQRLKALVFALSGAIAGLSGGLYAFHEGFVWPGMLGVVMSTQAVLYVLLGGAGTLIGAVVGTVVLESLSFWMADVAPGVWPIALGILLLVVVLLRPAGLVSLLAGERERVGRFGPRTRPDDDAGAKP